METRLIAELQNSTAEKVEKRLEVSEMRAQKWNQGGNPFSVQYPAITSDALLKNTPFICDVVSAAADADNQIIVIGGNYDLRQFIIADQSGKLTASQYKKVLAGLNATLAALSIVAQIQVNGSSVENPIVNATLYTNGGQAGIITTSVDFAQQTDQLNSYVINIKGKFNLGVDAALVIELKKPSSGSNTHKVNVYPTDANMR